MEIRQTLIEAGKQAKDASRVLRSVSGEQKNALLQNIAETLEKEKARILSVNAEDVQRARGNGLDPARINRLTLTPAVIAEMAQACRAVAAMPDPVGSYDGQWQQPNGMLVGRMRVPLGVIAMIFESRPNVVVDASILCLKAGNAVLLRGGSEASCSNRLLGELLQHALAESGFPPASVQVIDIADHEAIRELCKLHEYIDVMIPRGGEKLIRLVSEEATMPILKHDKGVCHLYVDDTASIDMAVSIAFNSKVQRPAACNSLECLLVHRKIAPAFLPPAGRALAEAGVILRANPQAMSILKGADILPNHLQPMQPDDAGKEYLSLTLAVLVVNDMEEAIAHIEAFGSRHTEIICTERYENAMAFVRRVDASMVGVNVSGRLNDGGQLGLGAEIGISTTKLHAYGPMGLRELTASKFTVLGNGQLRP